MWFVCSIGRSIDRSVEMVVVDRSVGQSTGQSIGQSIGGVVDRSIGRSNDRSADRPIGLRVGRSLAFSLAVRSTDRSNERSSLTRLRFTSIRLNNQGREEMRRSIDRTSNRRSLLLPRSFRSPSRSVIGRSHPLSFGRDLGYIEPNATPERPRRQSDAKHTEAQMVNSTFSHPQRTRDSAATVRSNHDTAVVVVLEGAACRDRRPQRGV